MNDEEILLEMQNLHHALICNGGDCYGCSLTKEEKQNHVFKHGEWYDCGEASYYSPSDNDGYYQRCLDLSIEPWGGYPKSFARAHDLWYPAPLPKDETLCTKGAIYPKHKPVAFGMMGICANCGESQLRLSDYQQEKQS